MSRALAIAFTAASLGMVALSACGGGDSGSAAATTAGSAAAAVTSSDASSGTTAAGAASTAAAAAASGSGAAATDPCALITASEASSFAGATFEKGTEAPFSGGTDCIYQSGPSAVIVQIFSAPGSAQALAAAAPQFAPDAAPIDGIGDAAYFSVDEGTIGVLKNGKIFTVTVSANGQPASKDIVEAAAKTALAKL